MNLDAVRTEIEGLRLHATPEEKARLDAETHSELFYGVYDQLTDESLGRIYKLHELVLGERPNGFTPLESYFSETYPSDKKAQIFAYIKGDLDTLPAL